MGTERKTMFETTPTELDVSKLPVYQERVFVPKYADLTNAKVVAELYQKLIDRPIGSADDLEKFLADRSELDAAVDQAGAVVFIKMTCQTDDQERTGAYKKFIEEIEPVAKSMSDQLNRKYLDANEKFPLDEDRYMVYRRAISSDVELFREENIKLQTDESFLSQESLTICGAMTVDFNGQEKTMPEMRKLREEPDRSLRESAWRATFNRRLKDADKLEDIFDKMLSLRIQIAKNAGCDNYMDYKFKEWHRFDYTPLDCKNYHKAVKKTVVPVLGKIMKHRTKHMQVSSLRPWDMAVDPKGREPLKPFETIKEYKNGISEIFGNIDAEFKLQFDDMDKLGLLDLASRKGKAHIDGYQCPLAEARKCFIFTNAVGVDADILALTHEGGHAFHDLACSNEPLFAYRDPSNAFGEVASISMELFAMPYYNVFYNAEDSQRSQFKLLHRMVDFLTQVAIFDSFEHWIYENPDHDKSARAERWVKLCQDYGGQFVDWSGLEKERQCDWHTMVPLFQFPFYMIKYGIAVLGALGLWLQFKEDKNATIANYKKALALGGSRPLPELFEAARLKFDFSEETIAPLMEIVVKELSL